MRKLFISEEGWESQAVGVTMVHVVEMEKEDLRVLQENQDPLVPPDQKGRLGERDLEVLQDLKDL